MKKENDPRARGKREISAGKPGGKRLPGAETPAADPKPAGVPRDEEQNDLELTVDARGLEEAGAEEKDTEEQGRRISPRSAGIRESKSGKFKRIVDAATDLTNRILDWTDAMTDHFEDIASDPENDSIAARMIRSSEEIVDTLEEQQRETDDEYDVEERMRAAREQPKRIRQPQSQSQPAFVFYTAEDPDTPVNLGELAKGREKPVQAPEKEEKRDKARWETPGESQRATLESLFSGSDVAPGPSEGEPRSKKQPKKQPKKRAPKPKDSRQPVRPRPPKAPIARAARKRGIMMTRRLQYRVFLLVLGVFGILGILAPLRADSTSLEDRALTEKPALSAAGLWNGDYFGELEQWYSDTYPLRDRLAGGYDLLNPLGFGAVNGDAAAEEREESPETA